MNEKMITTTIEQESTQIVKARTLDQLKANAVTIPETIEVIDYAKLAENGVAIDVSKSSLVKLRNEVKTNPAETTIEEIKLGFFLNNTSYETVLKERDSFEVKGNKTADDRKHLTACNEYLVELEHTDDLHNGGKSKEKKQPSVFDKLLSRVEKVAKQISNKNN
jgi:hypothetical protein